MPSRECYWIYNDMIGELTALSLSPLLEHDTNVLLVILFLHPIIWYIFSSFDFFYLLHG